jgi:hypothetical protein
LSRKNYIRDGKRKTRKCKVVIYENQKDKHEKRKTTGAQAPKGQQEGPLPETFGGDFQNHGLKNTHTPTRTRKGKECEG